MRLLNRYIAKTIFAAVSIVLLVIVALDVLALLVDELGNLSDTYTFVEILIYIGLRLPASLYEFMPFAALVGSLVGLGALATTSELVILRSAGVSLVRISIAVMQPVLVFIVLALLAAEFLIPLTDQMAESRRSLLLGEQQTQQRHGLWNREGDEFMHFETIERNGTLHGITRYRFNDQGELSVSSFTEKATYQAAAEQTGTGTGTETKGEPLTNESQGIWLENNITETLLPAVATDTQTPLSAEVKHFASRPWQTQLTPALLNVLVLEPETLAIGNLYAYSRYLDQQNVDSSRYRLSFWTKALQPLATLSLVLIAISFVFGPLREVTMGYRVFTGVIVGIVFQMSQNLLGPASLVYGFPPLIAVLLPIAACLLLGIFLLRRIR